MPYYGDPNMQRNAIVQALLNVANPQPRTQIPGAQGQQGGFGATRAPNVLGPQTPGEGPSTASSPGIPGVPGTFNPAAAPTPPAAGPMDPNGVQGPVVPGQPGAFGAAPAGGAVGRPLAPPQMMPQQAGGMPAPPPGPVPALLNNMAAQPNMGSQLTDPTRPY
jgi:hypothetical protein